MGFVGYTLAVGNDRFLIVADVEDVVAVVCGKTDDAKRSEPLLMSLKFPLMYAKLGNTLGVDVSLEKMNNEVSFSPKVLRKLLYPSPPFA